MDDSAVARPGRAQPATSAGEVPWGARLGGGLLMGVGLINALLGALSLTTTMVRLAQSTAGGLVIAGILTAVGGLLVWRGNLTATMVTLAAFVGLLIVQTVDVASHGPGVASGGVAGRFAVLVLVVAALAVAAVQLWPRAPRRGR